MKIFLLQAGADAGETLKDWVGAAVAALVAFALAALARWAVRRLGTRADTVTTTVQIVARLVFAVIGAVGVYVALRIIGLDLGPVLAGAGIAGIALAFAVKDIVENYISGILMGFRNPFNPGDEIVSGEHEGAVEELNLRYTTIRTDDEVRCCCRTGRCSKSPLTNLTVNGSRRTDFGVGVAYGTDLEYARQVMVGAVRALDGVQAAPPPQAWVEELAGSWITIRVRYWHPPRIADMWEVRSAAIAAVVAATRAAGIELPLERTVVEIARENPADVR